MRRGASYTSILLGKRVCQTGEPLRVGEEGGVDYDFMIFFIFSKCDSVVGGKVRFMIELELKNTEKEIENFKKNSSINVISISEEITSKVIEKISGEPMNLSSVKAAVLETSKNMDKQ